MPKIAQAPFDALCIYIEIYIDSCKDVAFITKQQIIWTIQCNLN